MSDTRKVQALSLGMTKPRTATARAMRQIIDATVEDMVLLVGGMAATMPLPDPAIIQLMRGLAGVRRIALRRADQLHAEPVASRATPHPAITRFLRHLRHQERRRVPPSTRRPA